MLALLPLSDIHDGNNPRTKEQGYHHSHIHYENDKLRSRREEAIGSKVGSTLLLVLAPLPNCLSSPSASSFQERTLNSGVNPTAARGHGLTRQGLGDTTRSVRRAVSWNEMTHSIITENPPRASHQSGLMPPRFTHTDRRFRNLCVFIDVAPSSLSAELS